MNIHTQRLIKRLGHSFSDFALLNQALTHRSVGSENNERLEFLGDAILGMVIAEQLYQRCPVDSEGTLTRIRASLVKKETLADIARELDLGPHLNLGGGELKSGGARRDSILADTVEAIIGAVFLDAGMPVARQVLLDWFSTRIEQQLQTGNQKDPKTALQEYLQGRGKPLPSYQIVATEGEPHCQQFTISCSLESQGLVVKATDSSKRAAEKSAAKQLLDILTQGNLTQTNPTQSNSTESKKLS